MNSVLLFNNGGFFGVLGAESLGEWVGRNEMRPQGEASPYGFLLFAAFAKFLMSSKKFGCECLRENFAVCRLIFRVNGFALVQNHRIVLDDVRTGIFYDTFCHLHCKRIVFFLVDYGNRLCEREISFNRVNKINRKTRFFVADCLMP